MKILLTGANGQLGREIMRHNCLLKDHQVIPLSRNELDISQKNAIYDCIIKYHPDVVINSAAYTQVDKAEVEQETSYIVNAQAVKYIAEACKQLDIPLIHISTDYVFNGLKAEPYIESDETQPINIYGKTKLQGEEFLRENLFKHVILRVSWVYGYFGHNFVKSMIRLAGEKEELSIVNDQKGCPTAAREIADAIYHIITKVEQGFESWGTYHFCNGPATTWYEFAKAIIEYASAYEKLKIKRIMPIPTSEYHTPAKRPLNSMMNCDKLNQIFQIKPRSWQIVLPEIIKELYS